MKNQMNRIKAIEMSLTPKQIVLLWMKQVLKGTFEQGLDQCASPRSAVANSVASNVRMALKEQPEDAVERAILQARREADLLYNLAIKVNTQVLTHFSAHNREYSFLLGYFDLMLRSVLRPGCEQHLRGLTLLFVEEVFGLDAVISQVRLQSFDGQTVLFSDCAAKLDEQLAMADHALQFHNCIAEQLKLPPIRKEIVYEELHAEIEQRVLLWTGLAEAKTLGVFGTGTDCRASIRQCIRRLRGDSVPFLHESSR